MMGDFILLILGNLHFYNSKTFSKPPCQILLGLRYKTLFTKTNPRDKLVPGQGTYRPLIMTGEFLKSLSGNH
ncbi:hypothetical protein ELAC_0085 [Estrella lausannensis]|uniref:Uncharacterized protein n=1 Tax=Estrella lausannensis TaxID=483423 RepID=A0A0H5DNR1_9BACT|nr:hypothetical protein ELAC_0085 [Estrella lausannensis]